MYQYVNKLHGHVSLITLSCLVSNSVTRLCKRYIHELDASELTIGSDAIVVFFIRLSMMMQTYI